MKTEISFINTNNEIKYQILGYFYLSVYQKSHHILFKKNILVVIIRSHVSSLVFRIQAKQYLLTWYRQLPPLPPLPSLGEFR